MIDLDMSLGWHLGSNHFPPVHPDWIPVCKRAIRRAQAAIDADPYAPITGRVRRPASHGGGLVAIVDVIDGLHLDGYLTFPEDDVPCPCCHDCEGDYS